VNTNDNKQKTYKRKPYYNIYKPLMKDSAGAALQFSYDSAKQSIYLEAARQRGPKLEIGSKEQFDWDNKIVFKLGVADVGQLILMFTNKKTEVKCIHKPQDGKHTSVLEMRKQTGDYDNYQLKLSKTEKDEGGASKTNSVGLFVDHHEFAILSHFFRESLTRMLGFLGDDD
jgi:hypothetical protein